MSYSLSNSFKKQGVRTTPSGESVSKSTGTPINPKAGDIVSHEDEQVAAKIDEALSKYFPAKSKNGDAKLEVEGTYVDRSNDDAKKPGKLGELRRTDRSYNLPIKSKVRLKYNGETVDERDIKVGDHHPIIPGLNTRLIDGNLYQSKFQVRRRPGAYPYRSSKGQDRIEFNTKGKDFQFVVDGEKTDTSTLDMFMTSNRQNIERGGYAMMRALGHSDEDLKEKWGEDIWRQNAYRLDADGNPKEKLTDKDLKKIVDRSHNALVNRDEDKKKSDSFGEAKQNIKELISNMDDMFDRDVNRQTLGVPSGTLDDKVIDSSLDQLVKQHTGKKDPPHRFSEKFRDLHGMPDQIEKALSHWRFSNKIKPDLKRVLNEVEGGNGEVRRNGEKKSPTVGDLAKRPFKKIRDQVSKKYKNSDLSATTETNNILDIEGRSKEITIGGEGGIQNEHAITPETISLHPSRLGLMDIVKTQVSMPGKTMPMASGATITKDDDIKRMAYDRELGKMRAVSTEEIDEDGLGFPDEFNRKKEGGSIVFEPKSDKIKAAVGDEVRSVDEKDVRYVLTDETHMFSDNTNIVPFLNHDSGPRAIMGANQMTQGLSLKNPDKPLVDPVDEEGKTFSKRIGERYNAKAPASGTVENIENEKIEVKDENGKKHTVPLLKNFPFNQGGFLNHEPVVAEGDSVSQGDLLTKNNYTDQEGNLAIGKNLRTAYVPYDGWNYEDAIVMSESGAKKLTSESIKEKTIEYGEKDLKNPNALKSLHNKGEKKLTPQNEAKLGEDGVIREGETVEPGEVLATSVRPVDIEEGSNEAIKRVRNVLGEDMKRKDASLKYKGTHSGKVVKVENDGQKVKTFIKTEEPFREGDKLTGRHGEKGIVSKILSDDEMLQDKDGNPMDILLDPHGVPSRANPGQIMELAAGKLADETGEQYKMKNFTPDQLDKLKNDLEEEGLSDKETLVDPKTGREIPDVATGKAYKAKLKHKLDKKFKARKFFDRDSGYGLDEQPVDGASMDNLTLHALIGHNARANLSEMARIKGTKNGEYWRAMANNNPLPDVQESPYSFKKLRSMIKGLGVNVEDQDAQNGLKLSPMTDKDIEAHSSGEVTDPGGKKVTKHSINAMDSSIFDPNIVGRNGDSWNHVELGEKVPNPLFDKAIGLMLQNGAGTKNDENVRIVKEEGGKGQTMRSGLNFKDIKNVYTGNAQIQIDDKRYTGSEGLQKALGTVDIDKTLDKMKGRLKNEFEKVENGDKQPDGTEVTNLHMGIKYAKGLKEKDMRPKEGYMTSKMPVMPLKFRKPIVNQESGKIMMPSVNNLYRSVIADSNKVQFDKENGFDDEQMKGDRERLYQSLGALVGASGSRPRGDYSATGILDQISSPRSLSGDQEFGGGDTDAQGPKGGFAQSKVVKKKMEGSGRSTIIPDPDISVDKVGLPEEMAWRMYEPFARRRMIKNTSLNAEEAKKEYKNRSKRSKKILKEEMKQRPVMLNRDPSWWKYNVMGFEPELRESDPENPIAEKAIRVPNLVVNSYFGGDFDGDTMSVHVPTEPEAVEETKKMKPSKHLKAPGSYNLMINPNQSMLMGMNLMSEQGEVSDESDAKKTDGPISDYERGNLSLGDTADYKGKKQPAGWAMIDQAIDNGSNGDLRLDDMLSEISQEESKKGNSKDVSRETLRLNKWGMEDKVLSTLVDQHPDKYASIVNEMSRAGNLVARNEGFTVGLSDMKTLKGKANKLSQKAEEKVPKLSKQIAKEKYGMNDSTKKTDDEARIRLYGSAQNFDVEGEKTKSVTQSILDEIENSDEDDNAFFKMQKVGSKGNEKQIQQVLGSYGVVDDVQGNTIPNPIKNSLSDGLTSSEYFTQQHGAIAGLRDRSVETSKPGDIGKQIVASSSTLLVTEEDCGTMRGEDLPIFRSSFGSEKEELNRDLIDRVLAEDILGTNLRRGDIVDGDALAKIKNADAEEVKVRSPLRCEASEGACKKCYGLDETGAFPEIGENVGIKEGQSIVEASTKLTLKSFHTGGASDESLGGFDDFEEVVHLKTPHNKATVAKMNGPLSKEMRVEKIKKNRGPSGNVSSYSVSLDGRDRPIRVPGDRTLEVSEGDTVQNGERLTKGRRDPNELIDLGVGNEGVQEVQKDTTNNLHAIFEDIGNIGRRTAETVVSAMSGLGRITDPGHSEFTIGDEQKVSRMESFNKEDVESIPINEADGRVLAEDVKADGMTYNKGQKLKPMIISSIRMSQGSDFEVKVESDPIQYNQKVKSVLNLPRSGDDWLPKLNYRKIKQEARRSSIRSDESPVRGTHPVSAYMYGKNMDKGDDSERWAY